ncbi:21679_t:CDS:2 [Entrophospora sp. SA101]|nr:14836_t:CDS:2 [Entrophospora candida]CAG8467276.1 4826_t:CDS:2 [Entrophospora candida]CAH1763904.1 5880_t:CDS:2 [Entrophospora sp. SA101]CAJ0748683.1 6606_t:CDS:2 [Entrophospora sp. SA101]CAJ0755355.1 21679_t:CDS:2 [Entrophospora sp. SA101]
MLSIEESITLQQQHKKIEEEVKFKKLTDRFNKMTIEKKINKKGFDDMSSSEESESDEYNNDNEDVHNYEEDYYEEDYY